MVLSTICTILYPYCRAKEPLIKKFDQDCFCFCLSVSSALLVFDVIFPKKSEKQTMKGAREHNLQTLSVREVHYRNNANHVSEDVTQDVTE